MQESEQTKHMRRTRLEIRYCVLPLLALCTLGCTLRAQSAPADTSIVVLRGTDNARALGSLRLVVRDSAEYQRVWADAWNRYATPPLAPRVDFARYDVVVIAVGPQPITGGGIELTRIEVNGSGRTFHITLTVPGAGCVGGTAMTYNALFVRVPRASSIPLFRDRLSAPRCE